MNRSDILAKWKVHKFPKSMGDGYYLGPVGGRQVHIEYATRDQAICALWMKEWLVDQLVGKKRKGSAGE